MSPGPEMAPAAPGPPRYANPHQRRGLGGLRWRTPETLRSESGTAVTRTSTAKTVLFTVGAVLVVTVYCALPLALALRSLVSSVAFALPIAFLLLGIVFTLVVMVLARTTGGPPIGVAAAAARRSATRRAPAPRRSRSTGPSSRPTQTPAAYDWFAARRAKAAPADLEDGVVFRRKSD